MRMGTTGNGNRPVRGVRQEPGTAEGRELLALIVGRWGSLKAASVAMGLHFQSLRRTVYGDPRGQSVSTHRTLKQHDIPERLLDRAG